MNRTYLAMAFKNKDLNIDEIYFTEDFLNEGVVNPITQKKYTNEEKESLSLANTVAPVNAYIGISSYKPAVLWFDKETSFKIVSHTDALMIKDNGIYTLTGELVAKSL